jgi:glycosidase
MQQRVDPKWVKQEATRSLGRILPGLEEEFAGARVARSTAWLGFTNRLQHHFPTLFRLLLELYGDRYDFFYYLEQILREAARASLEAGDRMLSGESWLLSNEEVGGVCYADLYAGKLDGLLEAIPSMDELGLTYLHLMPLFRTPEGEHDGGYAVSDFRQVAPALGTMEDLKRVAEELHRNGKRLVLDFILNHTSEEHPWALAARSGDREAQEIYRMFPDRELPDLYQEHLRDIFPDQRRGSFTWRPEIEKWVWTTFHSYQWDLNYANPEVFCRMAGEMLFLAGVGVDVLRLDAVAFLWKEMGTSCENLPGAHTLIRALAAVARIGAPGLVFKSEAIVHPDEVVRYIDREECALSYNPLLMALLWNTLATREVNLLALSMQRRFALPEGCAWVNYLRCHDDIGWTFDDGDAWSLDINGQDHRQFLNAFYLGNFEGSFARGLPFQEDLATGDCRISGTLASLAGLEKAILEENEAEIQLCVWRILLLHGIILSIGGIPLIYLGDEFAQLNDYSFRDDPEKSQDSRWVHRPARSWKQQREVLEDTSSPGARVYRGLQKLIRLRKQTQAFAGSRMDILQVSSPHVLAYLRQGCHRGIEPLLVLANFSEFPREVTSSELKVLGWGGELLDLISGEVLDLSRVEGLNLEPYRLCWLQRVTDRGRTLATDS